MKKLCGNCEHVEDGERDHIGICTKHNSRMDKRVDVCLDWKGDEEDGTSEEIVEGPAGAEEVEVEEASGASSVEEQPAEAQPEVEAEAGASLGEGEGERVASDEPGVPEGPNIATPATE